MKKLFAILLTLVMVVTLFAGCGNHSLGLGSFTFTKIHIETHNYSGCFTVEKWYESGTGIEVKTTEAGSIFVSEGMYVLLEGNKACPFCANHE